MPSDAQQLQQWAAGDKEAGRALIDRHVDGLTRFFQSKFGVDVDDHVQETFERILGAHAKLRPDSDFRAYLFAIARNVVCDAFRTSSRRDETAVLRSSVADLAPSPSAVHVEREEARILLEALRRLPLDSQMLLELFYWEQLSVSQLAVVLDVAEGTIKSRLHRARGALREGVDALVRGHETLAATLTDLDAWARALRDQL